MLPGPIITLLLEIPGLLSFFLGKGVVETCSDGLGKASYQLFTKMYN